LVLNICFYRRVSIVVISYTFFDNFFPKFIEINWNFYAHYYNRKNTNVIKILKSLNHFWAKDSYNLEIFNVFVCSSHWTHLESLFSQANWFIIAFKRNIQLCLPKRPHPPKTVTYSLIYFTLYYIVWTWFTWYCLMYTVIR